MQTTNTQSKGLVKLNLTANSVAASKANESVVAITAQSSRAGVLKASDNILTATVVSICPTIGVETISGLYLEPNQDSEVQYSYGHSFCYNKFPPLGVDTMIMVLQSCHTVRSMIQGFSNCIRLCMYHSNHYTKDLLHPGEFKVLRCSFSLFKSEGFSVALNYGLNGGMPKDYAKTKKTAQLINQAKKRTDAYVKEVATASNKKNVVDYTKPVHYDPFSDTLVGLTTRYVKEWPHDNTFRFSVFQGRPVLQIAHEGGWTKAGFADELYAFKEDLNALLTYSTRLNTKFHPQIPNPIDTSIKTLGANQIVPAVPKRENTLAEIQSKLLSQMSLQDQLKEVVNTSSLPVSGESVDSVADSLFGDLPPTFFSNDPPLSEITPAPLIILDEIKSLSPFDRRSGPKVDTRTLTRANDGVATIGGRLIDKKSFNVLSHMLKYIKVAELAEDMLTEILELPDKQWNISGFAKLGNYTGANHPPQWDGFWRVNQALPVNEADFVSSFHDMIVDHARSADVASQVDAAFIEWWKDAGADGVATIMGITNLFADKGNVTIDLPDNIAARLGSEGVFSTAGEPHEIVDMYEGLDAGARGTIYDFGNVTPLVAASPLDEVNQDQWDVSRYVITNFASNDFYLFGQSNPSFATVFKNSNVALQTNSSLRLIPNIELAHYIGARFSPSLLVATSTLAFGQVEYNIDGVTLNPSLSTGLKNLTFKPSYDSLAAVNLQSTFSSVAAANRSYTITPYGDLSFLVYLFRQTNLFIQSSQVNLFQGCLRMIQYACISEPGSYEMFRGGDTSSPAMEYFGTPILSPSLQQPIGSIRFVKVADYVSLQNTAPMKAVRDIIHGPNGRIAFWGAGNEATNGIDFDTFILQLLMTGAQLPIVYHTAQTLTVDGNNGSGIATMIDVANLYASAADVNIIVFMGNNAPNVVANDAWVSLIQGEVLTSITNVDVAYDTVDLLGSYLSKGGYSHWITLAYNLAMSIGAGDYWTQAYLFSLVNFSVSQTAAQVLFFKQYSNSANMPPAATVPVFPSPASRVFGAISAVEYEFAPGLVLTQNALAGSSPVVDNDAITINVPRETGLEHLVIYGFAMPTSSSNKQWPAPPIESWAARYWLPEYMSQAFAETNRQFFFAESLYNDASNYSNYPPTIKNLYNWSGISQGMPVPKGLPYVADYFNKIIGVNVPFELVMPSITWALNHSSNSTSNFFVKPYLRQEFLVSASRYTSLRTTVWMPQEGSVYATPRFQKKFQDKMTNYRDNNGTYELSGFLSAGNNYRLFVDDDFQYTSYAIMNIASNYLSNVIRHTTSSQKASSTGSFYQYVFPAYRPSDISGYVGAQACVLLRLYYDLPANGYVAIRNAAMAAGDVKGKVRFVQMMLLTDANVSNEEGDPDSSQIRALNWSTIDSLFGSDIVLENPEAAPSPQQLSMQEPKVNTNVPDDGGVPVSRAQ